MSLLLYAITDRAPSSEGIGPGVHGRPVSVVSTCGLSAVVSQHDAAPRLEEGAAWAYEQVIETVMAHAAVVPIRFGSLVADEEAVHELLCDRAVKLSGALDRVRDRVEVSLRALWPQSAAPPAPARTGQEYMQARLAPTRRARALGECIRAALDPLAHASVYRLLATPRAPVTAAYLVDRDATDAFVARAQALSRALPDAELACTGPWPAYSFVGT